MKKSDGVNEEGNVCARCGGLVFDPIIPQKRHEWVGLTDDEVVQCQQGDIYHFYRCIEIKLREKNSL